jgi:hypothetical protein
MIEIAGVRGGQGDAGRCPVVGGPRRFGWVKAVADEGPSIAEVIGEMRRQLEQAKADGERSSLRFDVGSVELTFTVGVDKTNGVGGGLKIWVLEAGARRDSTSTATHTVTVTLSPTRSPRTAAMSWSTSPGCGMADQTEPDAGRRVRSPRRSLGRR